MKQLQDSIEELGKGNNSFLPNNNAAILRESLTLESSSSAKNQSEEQSMGSEAAKDDQPIETRMVMHKGALIDIDTLLIQMSRSEKAREETEQRLVELTKSNVELQASSTKSKDKIKDLQSELKSCSRKLGDAESTLSSTNVSSLRAFRTQQKKKIKNIVFIYRKS